MRSKEFTSKTQIVKYSLSLGFTTCAVLKAKAISHSVDQGTSWSC